ncbi:TetR/AcrR family transcriptional regulator [Brachyspira hampsonii]|uniref:Transcriptional regulator n=2 Tax=Brachyspira hampsonii TaxID=1287055 RepID=A0A2U4FH90_9SPIR|nr:TetR/AcrR family transcriptional regulator [Brachyspira hampsonii]EKV56551.1 transcriptional regulator [Brachyspira hampsonii 30446]MBW5389732.1 TetR/AcrR family transcriptional regulator [Brachyspira hampsonii]MBW5394598.1 TetR/AcrR family transcriptional regulator [Brachyspira hampsonii]OEJ18194.1 transcriptional regulator [Brachyspira hampsonii]
MTPREQIVNAGKRLFKKYGFKKASMSDIALMVHKSKSSIYHYFKSKEEIFFAIAENEANDLKKELYEAIKKEDTAETKLRAYILTRQKGYIKLANLYEALHSEIFEDFTLIEHMRAQYHKEEYNTIKMILRSGVKKGLFNIDLRLATEAVLAIIKGFELEWAKNKNSELYEKDLDTIVNIIFYGIVKRN